MQPVPRLRPVPKPPPSTLHPAGIREYARAHNSSFGAIKEEEVEAWLGSTTPAAPAVPAGGLEATLKGSESMEASSSPPTYSLFAYPAYDNYAGIMYPLSWVRGVQARSNATHVWKVRQPKLVAAAAAAAAAGTLARQQLALRTEWLFLGCWCEGASATFGTAHSAWPRLGQDDALTAWPWLPPMPRAAAPAFATYAVQVLLDAAAFVPTHRLNLTETPADFVDLSFCGFCYRVREGDCARVAALQDCPLCGPVLLCACHWVEREGGLLQNWGHCMPRTAELG